MLFVLNANPTFVGTRPPLDTPDGGSSGVIDSLDPEANLEVPENEDRGVIGFTEWGS